VHDVGGRVNLKSSDKGAAIFGGENDCYRYTLARVWHNHKSSALVVMMNPSTATETTNDPTIAKITRMVKRWDDGAYGALMVGNTFAYRATDQSRLLEVEDPIGPDNNEWLMKMAKDAQIVVLAYGTPKHKKLRSRGEEVYEMLKPFNPHILRLSKNNIPYHPLYLPENIVPQPWENI
jgi:hypothetical protein